jgi:AAA15 family ATPase/GTPase
LSAKVEIFFIRVVPSYSVPDGIINGKQLLVDEIENHFNKEIVTTLVRFFMDSRFNKNGGTLIFTTYYPELLDEYDRNDGR